MTTPDHTRRLHLRQWFGLIAAANVSPSLLPNPAWAQVGRSGGSRRLVAYFSRTGHTRQAALVIAQTVGADLFEIEPATPFPKAYQDTVELNSHQIASGEYPAVARLTDGLERYDTVYLGYPVWAVDLPRLLVPFLRQQDFRGKSIAPFCTSAMSGLASTELTLRQLCQGARLLPGLSLPGGGRGHNTLVTRIDPASALRSSEWGVQGISK